MAMPPNINNYTIPGGIKLFFDDGTGERDLGNIVNLDVTPGTDELEHFSNRSGKRAKDAIWTLEEKLSMKFTLDEPVMENWKYFLKGGPAESVGAGTAAKSDQKLLTDAAKYISVGQYYGLTGVTVRQFLDYCLVFDGADYVDNSTEADSAAGSPFTGVNDTDEFIYIGKTSPFKNVYFNVDTVGIYVTGLWEYWNGSAWTTFVPTGEEDFSADGNMVLGTLSGWAKTTVSGLEAYWIRFSAGTVTQACTILAIRQNCVVNVDYSLDPGSAAVSGRLPGRVARIVGGMLEDGEEVKVSFTYVTFTGLRFPIGGSGFATGAARLEVHPSTGRGLQFDIEIPKCQLKPDGNIGLDDKKVLEMSMTLEVLDNSSLTPDYPYGRFIIYET